MNGFNRSTEDYCARDYLDLGPAAVLWQSGKPWTTPCVKGNTNEMA